MKLLHLLLALSLALFSAVTFAQPIDINTATAKELADGVHGLGKKRAEAIVKYREANGVFKSINDLTKVKGIKEKTLEGILADKRNQLTVGEVTPTAAADEKSPADAAVAAEENETPADAAAPAKDATSAAPAAAHDTAHSPAVDAAKKAVTGAAPAAQDAAAAAKEAAEAAQKTAPATK